MLSLCVNRAVGFTLKGNFCRELASDGFCGADFGGQQVLGIGKSTFVRRTCLFIHAVLYHRLFISSLLFSFISYIERTLFIFCILVLVTLPTLVFKNYKN